MNFTEVKGKNKRKTIAFVLIITMMITGLIAPITSMAGSSENGDSLKVTFKVSDKKSDDIEVNVDVSEEGTAVLKELDIPNNPTAPEGSSFVGWQNKTSKDESVKDKIYSKNDLVGTTLAEETTFEATYEESANEESDDSNNGQEDSNEEANSKIDAINGNDDSSAKKKDGGAQPQADDGNLTLSWSASDKTEQDTNILEEQGKNLTVSIPGENAGVPDGRKLIITYNHVNTDDFTTNPTDTGFKLGDYTKVASELISGEPVYDPNAGTLTYNLKDTYGSGTLNVPFSAPLGKIYKGEKLAVNAKIVNGNDEAIVYKSARTATATAEVKNIAAPVIINLISPSNMRNGEGKGLFGFKIYSSYRKDCLITYDFTNLMILSGGVTKTYAEWMADGNSPIVFSHKGEDITSKSGFKIELSYKNTIGDCPIEKINYRTTEEFTGGKIDYKAGLVVGQKYKREGRGPWVDSPQGNSNNDVMPDNTGEFLYLSVLPFKAVDEDLMPNIYPIPNIQPNSIAFENDPEYGYLYNSYLFSTYIESTRLDEDAEGKVDYVKYDIPNGMNITQIKMPNTYCKYDTVEINGTVYSFGANIKFKSALSNSITMKFTGLKDIALPESGKTGLASKMQFIGYTENLAPGSKVGVSVQSDGNTEFGEVKYFNLSIISDNGKMIQDPAVGAYDQFLKSSTGAASLGNAIEKAKSFTIQTRVAGTNHPYSSAYFDDVDKLTTAIFPSPVCYIDIPGGMKVDNNAILSGFNANLYKGTVTNIFENQGKWGTSGGAIVEVKLTNTDGTDATLKSANYLDVALKLTVPADFDENQFGSNFLFDSTSMRWSSYDPSVISLGTNGSWGITVDFNLPEGAIAKAGNKAVIRSGKMTNNLQIIMPASASVVGSVKVGTDYVTYISGDALTLPERPAGSDKEEFQFYMGYGKEAPLTNATAYFIVPQGEGWRPALNAMPTVDMSGLKPSEVKMYYTTNTNASNWTPDNLNASGEITATWNPLILGEPAPFDEITAIKYVFTTLESGDSFRMNMPFGIPKVETGSDIKYGSIAYGKTLFQFGTEKDYGGAPAIKVIKTNPPQVREKTANSDIAIVSDPAVTVPFGNDAAIPNWYDVATYDDFTAGIKLTKAEVEFIEQGKPAGSTPVVSIINAFTNVNEYDPGVKDGVQYEKGFSQTIANPTNYISSTKPGTYKVKYYSGVDGDGQTGHAERTIIVVKNTDNSLSSQESSIDFFYDQSMTDVVTGATSWDNVYRSKLKISDKGLAPNEVNAVNNSSVVLDKLVNNNDPQTDIKDNGEIEKIAKAPGKYTATYRYTDKYGNTVPAYLTIIVKFRGNIEAQVKMDTYPVSGASITGLVNKITGSNGSATFGPYEATTSSPILVGYFLTLDNVPAGYKMPEVTTKSGILTKGGETSTEFEVSPVAIKAEFISNSAINYMKSVSLWKKGSNTPVKTVQITNGEDSYTFLPENGNVFTGEYYMTTEIKDGYTVLTDSDFQPDGDKISVTTGAIANDDISKILKVELNRYSITFKAGTNGSFDNSPSVVTVSGIGHGTTFGAAVASVPVPVADPDYYFAGWTPTIPAKSTAVTDDAIYVANFAQKKTITFTAKDATTKVYNDEEYSVEVPVELSGTLISGHAFNTTTATAVGQNAGTYATTFSAVNVSGLGGKTLDYYYNYTFKAGNFVITKRSIEVKPVDVARMYKLNQQPLKATEIALTTDSKYQLVSGHKLGINQADLLGSLSKPGVTESAINGADKVSISGKEANYDISITKGSIIIYTNNMDLGISATGSTNVYDGKAHGLKEAVATMENVNSTAIPVMYSTNGVDFTDKEPTFTDVGTYTVYVTASLEGFTSPQPVIAQVTITERPITVTANSNSKIYDGTSLNAKGEKIDGDGLVSGETLKATYKGSRTVVGESDAVISSYEIKAGSKDTTKNYKVTTKKGTLKVNARPVLIAPNNAEKTFDGQPLVAKTVKVQSNSKYKMLSGDKLTDPKFSASRTSVGTSKVKVISVKVNGKVNNNYVFASGEGTLRVNAAPVVEGETADPRVDPTGTDTTYTPVPREVLGSQTTPGPEEFTAPVDSGRSINDNLIPTTTQDGFGWALINLILTIAGLVVAAMIGIIAISRKMKGDNLQYNEERDQYYEEKKNSRLLLILGTVLLSIGGLVLFLLTEDMDETMVLVDSWTIYNLIIFILEVVAGSFAFRTKTEEIDISNYRY